MFNVRRGRTRAVRPWWVVAFVCIGCESLPVLAPTGSTITLVSSASSIPLGGEASITAHVTEEPGTPVPNGTRVVFSTSLGRVEPVEVATRDGRATARLLAGSIAGTAELTATSGVVTSETIVVGLGGAPGP